MHDAKLFAQRTSDDQQRFDKDGQIRDVFHELLDARLKLYPSHHADLEPKVAQGGTQIVLDSNRLRLQQLAMGQPHPQLWTAHCLHMHWPVEPRPHHLRHAAGIIAISLVDLSLQRCAHVPRLYANYGQACLSQSAEQPLRQWPRFQSDPLELIGPVLEHLQESVRIALNLRFADNPTCVIHNAQARQLDRYVQSSKMLHAALLLLMLEALTTVTSFHHQPEAQHPNSSAIHKNAGRLPHLRASSRITCALFGLCYSAIGWRTSDASYGSSFAATLAVFVPGMISKRGSKSTMVDASCFKMLGSPCTFAVPSAICTSRVFVPIIVSSRSPRLMVRVKSGLLARKPLIFVSVAFSSSTMNFSPLSGVIRLIVNLMPSALRLSMRMPRKFRNNSVDIARITSGLLGLGVAPCGIPVRSS